MYRDKRPSRTRGRKENLCYSHADLNQGYYILYTRLGWEMILRIIYNVMNGLNYRRNINVTTVVEMEGAELSVDSNSPFHVVSLFCSRLLKNDKKYKTCNQILRTFIAQPVRS